MPLNLDAAGWVAGIRYIASPNCDERPAGSSIELLVVHCISLPPGSFGGEAVIDLFTNRLDFNAHPFYQTLRDLKVSAHFFIRRDGELIQFVACGARAWHAGASQWCGRSRCNDFSIGVELEGSEDEPFADAQYDALAELTCALRAAYALRDTVGHADIAPGRKSDPGRHFDWARFRAAIKDE